MRRSGGCGQELVKSWSRIRLSKFGELIVTALQIENLRLISWSLSGVCYEEVRRRWSGVGLESIRSWSRVGQESIRSPSGAGKGDILA